MSNSVRKFRGNCDCGACGLPNVGVESSLNSRLCTYTRFTRLPIDSKEGERNKVKCIYTHFVAERSPPPAERSR